MRLSRIRADDPAQPWRPSRADREEHQAEEEYELKRIEEDHDEQE